jgi:ATP-binding cassette subfamily B protein
VIAALPGGLDGEVGEQGARLSSGQRQRVAIARPLLRRASLLMLDEATSALDAITEELVREAIANAARRATMLVITHRFATIRRADKVIVLNQGRVVTVVAMRRERPRKCSPIRRLLIANRCASTMPLSLP